MIVDLRSTVERPFRFSMSGLPLVWLWLVLLLLPVTTALAVDVTDQVDVSMTRLRFNSRTLESSTRVTLGNMGGALQAPIRAFIGNISRSDVTVANADGEENGIPFFAYPEALLAPGATSTELTWKFDNPNRASFTFNVTIDASIPPGNTPPAADAGTDQTGHIGDTIQLDGSGSTDADGDELTYSWSLTAPQASSAILSDPDAARPSFVIDVSGTYSARLIVNDGTCDSAPDTVDVFVPATEMPIIDVSPNPLEVGEVVLDQYTAAAFSIKNSGTSDLEIYGIQCNDSAFTIVLPIPDTVAPGATTEVGVVFQPTFEGAFAGTITISSNADNDSEYALTVTGTGVLSTTDPVPDIQTVPDIDFGCVEEEAAATIDLTISNNGSGTLNVSSIAVDHAVFEVLPTPGDTLPYGIEPGEARNLVVRFKPPQASAGSLFSGILSIESDDPDEPSRHVALAGCALAIEPPTDPNPVVSVQVDDSIAADNCSNVSGMVEFSNGSTSADTFEVILTDQTGATATSDPIDAPADAGNATFSGIDACDLSDGVIEVGVVLNRDGEALPAFIETPTVKNTTGLEPPQLAPLPAVTSQHTILVCGTARENTTVSIQGGAYTVSTKLGSGTTDFCLDVPLRSNTQNILIASAVDDLADAPKPTGYAKPVPIVQLDPSKVVLADLRVRLLTESEIADLVENGVIDLDDPDNYNVSMFTVVLTIGSFPVTISQPVAVHRATGTISYGGGGSAWHPGRTIPGGGFLPRPSGSGGGGQIVVIRTPSGHTIPGVIIIDGRIKTLKEFFQAKLILFNNSDAFVLQEMQATIDLPAGLTPMGAALGRDVADINTLGEIDRVVIGDIQPGQSGVAQFVFRGDAMGVHKVVVDFQGFITEGGLPSPVPVNGAACTTVEVQGPPKLSVVVRHPSDPNGPDVAYEEIYDLIVEITNESKRPALYTSLELFVGGSARLVDENDQPIEASNTVRTIGTIPPGRTARLAYRVQSLAEGEIIACQGIAAQNITLSVDTGPDGTDCSINTMYPADFEPLPDDMPPTVIGINPLNGEPNVPVTTSIVAVLTPRSECLTADTWADIQTAPIGGDPANGLEVTSATLAAAGTFYLEELGFDLQPEGHVPTELVVEHPPAGGTTIAVLRLGLAAPLSQTFLKPNTYYRVTLKGESNGVCSAASGAEMTETFTWIFSTAQDCTITADLMLESHTPADGTSEVPVNQPVTLNFSNRLDLGTIVFDALDIGASTFGVYRDAVESGGDLTEGTPVPGTLSASNLNATLVFTPAGSLPVDSRIYVRITDGLADVCDNALQTGGNGVQLISFHTMAPDTTAPDDPTVYPLTSPTNETHLQVSGEAEPGSTVWVYGAAAPISTLAGDSGLFSAMVPLTINTENALRVQAVDASGNASGMTAIDTNGDPLVVVQDSTPPAIVAIDPVYNAVDVPPDASITLTFSEPMDPATLTEANLVLIQGDAAVPGGIEIIDGLAATITPDSPLAHGGAYRIRIYGTAIQDLAGNALGSDLESVFTVEAEQFAPVADPGPDQQVAVGALVELDGSGSSDANGDELSYNWTLTALPDGSHAALSNATTVTPSFTADVAGQYTVQLVVNDGELDSAPAEVVISTTNTPPVADAGPDQTVAVGATVNLDGNASSDVDGDNLTYQWTLDTPGGSNAALTGADTATPSFTADVAGNYTVTLVVNDGTVSSSPDDVVISTENSRPVADAGPDQVVALGGTVSLDGTGSSDADGDDLTYQWSLSVPDGSSTTLSDATAVSPTFVPDGTGEYIAQLIVNDGQLDSEADPVTITVGTPPPPDLHYGDLVTGTISTAGEEDLYTFSGASGESILITITQDDGFPGSAVPYFSVFTPSGALANGTGYRANTQRRFDLTEDGTYVICVRANNFVSTGTYSLGLERLLPSAAVVDDTLAYGGLIQSTIDARAETDLYTFTGASGESILITITQDDGFPGSAVPYFSVFTPSGALANGTGYRANTQRRFDLTEDGTYVICVRANNFVSTGTYSLGIKLE